MQIPTKMLKCLPQSSAFWHCLTILFIGSLIINGVIYFKNFQPWSSQSPPIKSDNSNSVISSTPHTPLRSTLPVINQSQDVNPHNYRYILNQPDACVAKRTLVIIIVCTSIKNFVERDTIRRTWGTAARDPKSNVTILYLVGSGAPLDLQEKLENESNVYSDMIQEDFIDSYRNLSIKSQAMLKWVKTYCMTAKYVLKVDDDMFVNVPNLVTVLSKQKDEKFILGVTFDGARPVQSKESKWHTPIKDFNEKYYPRYTSGTAYSMSTAAVPALYTASLQLKMFWLEDIYITGLCARRAGIKRINDYGFSYVKRPVTGCAYLKFVTGHRNSPAEIEKIYKELHDPKLNCKNLR